MCKTSYKIKGSKLTIVENSKKRILEIKEISEVDISGNMIIVNTHDGKKVIPFDCLSYPVFDDICDFANSLNQETEEPDTPDEPETDKFGTTSITVCEISTGIIRTLVGCYEDGSWTWTNPITGLTVDIAGYIEPTNGFDFLDVCYARDDSDDSIPIKERPVVALDRYLNKNNEIVYFEKGTDPNSNPFNIENYTIMNLTTSPPVSDNLKKYLVPVYGVICIPPATSITLADVLAHAIANGATAYDGTVPTGTLNTSGSPMHAGLIAKDADGNLKKVGTSYLEINGQPVNAGTPWCKKEEEPQDEDCDGFLKGEDLTMPITNVSTDKSAAFIYQTCLIKLDADDDDSSVQ